MLAATAPCNHSNAIPDTFACQGSDLTRTHAVSASSFAGCPCHSASFCVGKEKHVLVWVYLNGAHVRARTPAVFGGGRRR